MTIICEQWTPQNITFYDSWFHAQSYLWMFLSCASHQLIYDCEISMPDSISELLFFMCWILCLHSHVSKLPCTARLAVWIDLLFHAWTDLRMFWVCWNLTSSSFNKHVGICLEAGFWSIALAFALPCIALQCDLCLERTCFMLEHIQWMLLSICWWCNLTPS